MKLLRPQQTHASSSHSRHDGSISLTVTSRSYGWQKAKGRKTNKKYKQEVSCSGPDSVDVEQPAQEPIIVSQPKRQSSARTTKSVGSRIMPSKADTARLRRCLTEGAINDTEDGLQTWASLRLPASDSEPVAVCPEKLGLSSHTPCACLCVRMSEVL